MSLMNDVRTVVKFINFIYPNTTKLRSYFAYGFAIIMISTAMIIPMPMLTRRILDVTLKRNDTHELLLIVTTLAITLLILQSLSYIRVIFFTKINNVLILKLRVKLIKAINVSTVSEVNKYGLGYLLSRINDDTNRLDIVFIDTMVDVLNDVMTFMFGLLMILYINVKLSVIALFVLPLLIFTSIAYGKKVERASLDFYEQQSITNEALYRSLNMIELCKLYARQGTNVLQYFIPAKKEFRKKIRLTTINSRYNLIDGILSGILPIAVLYFGGVLIVRKEMTIGSLIAFNSFIIYMIGPANKLTQLNVTLKKAINAIHRINELLFLSKEHLLPTHNDMLINKFSLSKISFSYCNKSVLTDISCSFDRGTITGITGISGSGKTTLVKLICGLYPIDNGEIYLNNMLITKDDIGNLRDHTSYAPFDPILINGTFIDQILFGNKQLNRSEIEYYATIAGVAEFVEGNQGYQRMIERGGSNLSSGQKQRLMLSTCFAKQTDIIVIDEAMTNLDLKIKAYILDQIRLLSSNKVVIIVSHDPFVLERCDKVYLLDKGQIIDSGHWNEIVKENSILSHIIPE